MHARDNLLWAIKSNHHDAVVRLITQVNLGEEIENKKTPIELACYLGHWDCVEAIAKNKRTDASDTARYGAVLCFAVDQGRIDTTKILLEAGAAKNWDMPYNGDQCLHRAVRRCNLEMIALLLSFDFDITAKNTAKKTPIELASHLEYWSCVEAIAKNKRTDVFDAAGYGAALCFAVDQGRIGTARILLEAGSEKNWDMPSHGNQCLHIAVRRRNVEMIALLLSFDFDIKAENTEKQTPIQLAYHLRYWDCVEAIAKNKRTDTSDAARYGAALCFAVDQGRIDTARILLKAGAAKSWYMVPSGDQCLHIAVRRCEAEMIALLLSFDFDIKAENKAKETPIELASRLGYWNCVEAITKNKRTDASDAAGYGAALYFAVDQDHIGTARILLETGIEKNWDMPSHGNQCLHIAVRRRNVEMIALLLSFGFDIKAENTEKQTPIQLAYHLRYWDCVEAIAKNKRTDASDAARYGAALCFAVDQGRIDTARILLKAGAAKSWYMVPSGDQCLHIAVRRCEAEMIALLLSFGFDLQVKNKAKQTPAQLADSLNTPSLENGWKMYYNSEVSNIMNVLTVFAQAARQSHSKFNVIYPVMSLILPFVSREIIPGRDTLESRKESFMRTSARCLIKSYHGIFRWHSSSPSDEFVSELNNVLKTNPTTDNIDKTVVKFLTKNNGNKSRALDLLHKYKLVTSEQDRERKDGRGFLSVGK